MGFVAKAWSGLGAIQRGIMRVIGLIVMILVLFWLVGALFSSDAVRVGQSGALALDLNGRIVEERTVVTPTSALQSALFGGGPAVEILLDDVVHGLRLAREDDSVSTIVLDLSRFAGATPASLHTIAAEMTAFRESGKTILAHSGMYGDSSWFLAAHADEVFLHNQGVAMIEGYSSFPVYLRGLLDRLGVTVNIFRVGEFKSAIEPFERADMSEADYEARAYLYGGLWNAYTRAAESARGLPAGTLQRLGDTADAAVIAAEGDLARAALDAGLVDQLVSRTGFNALLDERFGTVENGKRPDTTDFFEWFNANRPEPTGRQRDVIAVINAVGTIIDGEADGGVVGGDIHARLIRTARLDPNVKAIVLRIDSGGGGVFASELIREELAQAREDGLTVIASMGGVAASGGYWIATPAHEIWAHPTTITGSIGIFGLLPTFEAVLENIGVTSDGYASTRLGGAISLERGIDEYAARIFQASIERGYENFLEIVGEARGMSRDEVDAVAQGRVWTGTQALERGLVDQLGTFDQAVARAAELAELEDGRWRTKVFTEERSQLERILAALGMDAAARSGAGEGGLLARLIGQAAEEARTVELMNDPTGRYAVCLECPALAVR
ncbi:signal peptide peptidase SppA [Glycocaulis sp.]